TATFVDGAHTQIAAKGTFHPEGTVNFDYELHGTMTDKKVQLVMSYDARDSSRDALISHSTGKATGVMTRISATVRTAK
ncbi:MAG: hypothetical protein JO257_36315, partial [Deltaproteobacteria bacterium]|nr:hypothetical protein [Deltaproteobacteria bacterium]